jgi:DASH complex subunit DAD3
LHSLSSLRALANARCQMSALLLDLSNNPSAAILDGLRGLERKTSLVFTLLKASVYSIVLNQQIGEDGDERSEDGRSRGSVDGR